jgi:hypothetical protein
MICLSGNSNIKQRLDGSGPHGGEKESCSVEDGSLFPLAVRLIPTRLNRITSKNEKIFILINLTQIFLGKTYMHRIVKRRSFPGYKESFV